MFEYHKQKCLIHTIDCDLDLSHIKDSKELNLISSG